jgi:hypothetical protein
MALEAILRRAKVDVTTHGFCSSFRDWAGDNTAFARDVVEAWDKTSTLRESLLVWKTMTGSYNDLDRRPSIAHGMGELETVHRTRHVDIGKYHTNVAAALKYLDGFVSVGGLKDLKACFLSHFDGAPSNRQSENNGAHDR